MSVTTAIAVGLVAWLVLGTGLALLVGGIVGRRDRQRYGRVEIPRPRPAADDHVAATDDQESAADEQEPVEGGLRAGADRSARGRAGRGPARARD